MSSPGAERPSARHDACESLWPRARIRLAALAHNYRQLANCAGGAKVTAVVKANAYGHGLLEVVRHLPEADAFAVMQLSDAVRLKQERIEQPVMLLGGVYSRAELESALRHEVELVVHCLPQIELLEAGPRGQAVVWLKLDTGMHRLGFAPSMVRDLLSRLGRCRSVREVRVMTHLANADDRRDNRTARQIDRFASVLQNFDGQISIANSPGLLGWPDSISADFPRSRSWVRCGIALYGISPFERTTGADFGLRPVMQFETRLVGIKPIPAGGRVGYGGAWQAQAETVLGIVAAGYGDGYTRYIPSGTPVLINGRRALLAGRVSMDLAAVDLGRDATDKVGDLVTLWGEKLPVEEIAKSASTIPYQLVCGVTHREYVDAE